MFLDMSDQLRKTLQPNKLYLLLFTLNRNQVSRLTAARQH